MMNTRIAFVAIALTALSCQERVVSPACSPDAPINVDHKFGVRYRDHLQDALRCSRETGRPVLLLFDGYAQSNHACWEVLGNSGVQEIINDKLVLCVLMVDDRKPLFPDDTIGFPPMSSRRMPTTIGQRNTQLEIEYFQSWTQPLFALVDADFVSLAEPQGYVPKKEPELLVNWIEATLEQHP